MSTVSPSTTFNMVAVVATGSACATELVMTEHAGTTVAVTTVATNRVRFACLEICREGLTSLDLIFGAAMYGMATWHGRLTDDADAIVANSDAGTGQLINWSGPSRPRRSDAVSEARVPGARDRTYDHGPASSPRSC
jgi:hypothetical protein